MTLTNPNLNCLANVYLYLYLSRRHSMSGRMEMVLASCVFSPARPVLYCSWYNIVETRDIDLDKILTWALPFEHQFKLHLHHSYHNHVCYLFPLQVCPKRAFQIQSAIDQSSSSLSMLTATSSRRSLVRACLDDHHHIMLSMSAKANTKRQLEKMCVSQIWISKIITCQMPGEAR